MQLVDLCDTEGVGSSQGWRSFAAFRMTDSTTPPRPIRFAHRARHPSLQEGKFWRVISGLRAANAKSVKSMPGLIIYNVNSF